MVTTDTVDVFISHPLAEKAWASEMSRVLRDAGLRVSTSVLDQDPRSVDDAEVTRISDALRESRVWVLVLGEDVALTPTGRFEVGAAVFGDKLVITLVGREEARKELPQMLRRRNVVLRDGPEETGRRVLELIESGARLEAPRTADSEQTSFGHRP